MDGEVMNGWMDYGIHGSDISRRRHFRSRGIRAQSCGFARKGGIKMQALATKGSLRSCY